MAVGLGVPAASAANPNLGPWYDEVAASTVDPPTLIQSKTKTLAQLVRQAQTVAVYTGAGTSPPSLDRLTELVQPRFVQAGGDEGAHANLVLVLDSPPATFVNTGKPLCIVSPHPTSLDDAATLRIGAAPDEVIAGLVKELAARREHEEEEWKTRIPPGGAGILNEGLEERVDGEGERT
ncbi:hypothetical protein GLOTRDRAFT_140894 [Gloeophyllum trabeum ATCC 11539]|uniref:Uncharacterized protein n=1 Tax=Gloeophyllum trabeum (strain ATCC 11539 / FP-39264 / Madison 617) TaxID=670483 RepID=S7PVP1_GLOTA|nr:uncharacterized protein GLOTRDRAFT_140894 [Gloeophyllum trabeum ATCC 11539]EPQ51437.1 hypothetical protein GLOTRDRAFT_140894 [Gloeophyllum trabeum ATCC 11539]